MTYTPRKNCPDAEFFCFVFIRIWTEYGELRSKGDLRSRSPYSVQIQKNTGQKTQYLDTFHAVISLNLNNI